MSYRTCATSAFRTAFGTSTDLIKSRPRTPEREPLRYGSGGRGGSQSRHNIRADKTDQKYYVPRRLSAAKVGC